MKVRKRKKKETSDNKVVSKPSKEYTTEELIELGKKHNVLKLAPPLYKTDVAKNQKHEGEILR